MWKGLQMMIWGSEEFVCRFNNRRKMDLKVRITRNKIYELLNETVVMSIFILL